MPDIIFNPYLFLRTPALSYEDYAPVVLKNLLKSQFFQSAIFFASESLYVEMYNHQFEFDQLNDKVKFSLQKYFNRMCYRPTPFGMFSAFTSLSWNVFADNEPCVLNEGGQVYVNPDFQFTAEVARKMERSGEFTNVRYFLNRAIYAIKGEKRYLTERFDQKRKKTDFFINSFESNRLLNRLLNYCSEGRTKGELVSWLCQFVEDSEEAKSYVDDLIIEGLLVTELYPNMTGEKYFERIVKIAIEQKDQSELAKEVLLYEKAVADIQKDTKIPTVKIAGSDLYTSLKKKFKSMFYVGYEKTTDFPLDKSYQEKLREGLHCLKKITNEAALRPLNNFTTKFKARFEDQEVPLLLALDMEAGIGYEGLEANLVTSELLDGIQLDLQSNTLNFNWTSVHEFFLSRLVAVKGGAPIVIRDADLDKLKETGELKMPPSFSIIFRLYGDQVLIEQAGGCTATALLGRFSLFSQKVLEEVKHIASVEERSNENVIFAEISCFNDEHAANINSNAGVRKYEIPIGVHSTYGKQNIISLSDLTISIVGNQILLRSKSLNKIVIPRLSSAFNYSRSELTVFRFLCDLQYQGLKFSYNFDLRALLPGLTYYPRVEYKKCILYPATWILHEQDIFEIADAVDPAVGFSKISQKVGLKRRFGFTEGDNQLVFDQEDPFSVNLFVKIIKGKTLVILTEVFVDQPSQVINHLGQQCVGQFIASAFSDEVTYQHKGSVRPGRRRSKIKRVYLPGDEWVYFKLYCHPSTSNSILCKDVLNIITRLKKHDAVKSWFFIRYADPDHHLRIRIKIDPNDGARVVKYFEKKMRPQVERGTIVNLLLDTYKREIERYGEETIEHAEHVFNASSELVLNFLKNIRLKQPDMSEFHLAIISVDALLGVLFPENSDRLNLVKLLHEGMKPEFDDSKQVKVQLDNKYREYAGFFNNIHKATPLIIRLAGKKQFQNYVNAIRLLKSSAPGLLRTTLIQLAGDLIHMHLNRLFSDKQRNHEFIIYYLLYKYYVSAEARRGKSALSFTPTFKGFSMDEVEKVIFK